MFKGIDLSSDTASKPSLAMKEFMFNAELGDEQNSEDPTTLELEKMAARLFGFETAIFLPSATMANQIAIQALTNPGDILLAAENSHIFQSECGGPARHAQVLCRSIQTISGIFTDENIKEHYSWSKSIHNPTVKLLSIENTTNFGGGAVWPQLEINKIIDCANELKINTHLDGSRVFNACVKSKLTPHEMTAGFDMVTVCLSKGLGCPVGALLIFNEIYLPKVRNLKKLMGGAMRQTGILAAAGIYALANNVERLATDHEHAMLFATGLSQFDNKIKLINQKPETNIVLFEWIDTQTSTQDFLSRCREQGLRFSLIGKNILRAVMHLDISDEDVVKALDKIRVIFND